MTINNSRRHLTKVTALIVAIFIIFIANVTPVLAKGPILIDNNGTIKVTTESEGGVVDISAESQALYAQLRLYLGGTVGIVLITLTLAFVIKCGQLAASADNAQKRGNNITGMLYLIIAIAGVGAFDIVMNILVGLATKGF